MISCGVKKQRQRDIKTTHSTQRCTFIECFWSMKDFHDCWRTESRFFSIILLERDLGWGWGRHPGPCAESWGSSSMWQYQSFLCFLIIFSYFPNQTVYLIPWCRTQSTERSEWLLSDNSHDALPLSWGEDGWSVSFPATIESYPFHPDTSKVFIRVFFVHRTRKQLHLYYYGFSLHFFLTEQALDRYDFHGSAEWHFNSLDVGIFQQEGE